MRLVFPHFIMAAIAHVKCDVAPDGRIVGEIDVLLLAADIATDFVDVRLIVFALLDYNCFQKFRIAVTLFLALLCILDLY